MVTHQGELEVTLRAPYRGAPIAFDPSHDLLADLAALVEGDGELDPDARQALENELMRRFAAAPEAETCVGPSACELVMDLSASYQGQTIATITAADLREILFEIIPSEVCMEASDAREIVEDLRAFYGFLGRELGLVQADSCLRVLSKSAVKKLEAALSDASNFGVAKSLAMAGRDAGFDLDSPEGIEAWMRSIQGKPLPPSIALPSIDAPQPPPKKAVKAKKTKRKATRTARKKSR